VLALLVGDSGDVRLDFREDLNVDRESAEWDFFENVLAKSVVTLDERPARSLITGKLPTNDVL